ncbi:MAG: hypothetical protein AB203_00070 [Parcubacteria bacterium C7867-008]|nr:MAG: hypothetical protein AB203_00070 [Parcubacteria bacterium C7867-008]
MVAEDEVVLEPERYRTVVIIMIVVHILLLIITILTNWNIGIGIQVGEYTFWVTHALIPFLLLYDIASVRSVQTEENAGVTVLEHPAFEQGKGLVYAPPGFTELHKAPTGTQDSDLPGSNEEIYKGDEDTELPEGMVWPMRIPTAGPEPGSSAEDILDVRLTLEPRTTVFWQVAKIGFFKFYTNVPGRNWPEKKATILRIMRDAIESQLRIEFIQYTTSNVQKNQEKITKAVIKRLRNKMKSMGIAILDTSINGLEPDHATNRAMGEVPKARARRIALIHEAEGRKQAAILEAQGAAEAVKLAAAARIAQLEAEGKGLQEAASHLKGMDTQDYVNSVVAREVLGKGTTYFGLPGVVQALGFAKSLFSNGKPPEDGEQP